MTLCLSLPIRYRAFKKQNKTKFVKEVYISCCVLTTKKRGYEETFGGEGYVYYLDYGDGNTSIYL